MSGMDRKIEKRKWALKRIIWVAIVIVALGSVFFTFIPRVLGNQMRVDREKLVLSTVEYGPFQEYISIIGEAQPRTTVFLDATEGGRVETIFAEPGTMVQEGDAILRLSNTNLLLDVMFREAEFFEQSNNLRNTRLLMEQRRLELNRDMVAAEYKLTDQHRHFERQKKLFEREIISEEDYFKAKDEYEFLVKDRDLTKESMQKDLRFREQQVEQLEVSLNRMQDNLKVVKGKLESLIIKAPTSGFLTALNAEFIGESKAPGERLGRIDVMDGFKIRAPINEHFIARVEPGLKASFDLAGEAYMLEILKVFPEVKNGRFEVDLGFIGKAPSDLRRGQSLNIKLELGDLVEAVLLPRGGFYQTTGGNWVYVLSEDGGIATRREIRLNRMNTAVFEVEAGLKQGERVITSSYETFGNHEELRLD